MAAGKAATRPASRLVRRDAVMFSHHKPIAFNIYGAKNHTGHLANAELIEPDSKATTIEANKINDLVGDMF